MSEPHGRERVLVVAAHPDDECLGAGGAIQHHLARGDAVSVLFVTDGFLGDAADQRPARSRARRDSARRAAALFGIEEPTFLGEPGLELDVVPRRRLAAALESEIQRREIDTVYTHHGGDLNHDHRIVAEATLVACRPHRSRRVERVYAYEVPSATEWGGGVFEAFAPTRFLCLSAEQLERKRQAFACYRDEVFAAPHPRSLEGVGDLARIRGRAVSAPFAEAFVVLREVIGA
jgi:LmbE family N-acetylglucosaminyl deacetylase